MQQHCIDDAVDGCIRADAQEENEDGDQREGRRFAQSARGVTDVAEESFERRESAAIAVELFSLCESAELD